MPVATIFRTPSLQTPYIQSSSLKAKKAALAPSRFDSIQRANVLGGNISVGNQKSSLRFAALAAENYLQDYEYFSSFAQYEPTEALPPEQRFKNVYAYTDRSGIYAGGGRTVYRKVALSPAEVEYERITRATGKASNKLTTIKRELDVDITPDQYLYSDENRNIIGELFKEAEYTGKIRKERAPQGPNNVIESYSFQGLIGEQEENYQKYLKRITEIEELPEDTIEQRAVKRVAISQDLPLYEQESNKIDSDINRFISFRQKQLVEPVGYEIKNYRSLRGIKEAKNEFFGKVSQRSARLAAIKDPIEYEATMEQENLQVGFESDLINFEEKQIKRSIAQQHESRSSSAEIYGGPERPIVSAPVPRERNMNKLLVADRAATERFFGSQKQPRESGKRNSEGYRNMFTPPKESKQSSRNSSGGIMNIFALPKEPRSSGRNYSGYNFNFQKFINGKQRYF